jgi:hypothetical protein
MTGYGPGSSRLGYNPAGAEDIQENFRSGELVSALRFEPRVSRIQIRSITAAVGWCLHWYVHAPTEDKTDDLENSLYEELERVFHTFPK